ncbi:MAG: phosphoenolpyruvate synthase, partial [Thermodesulfobacteriota bacterium]
MTTEPIPPPLDSDALRANLLETAVGEVVIAPEYEVLLSAVANYKGIHDALHEILLEISHPFRNWKLILPKLRSFVLKNLDHYRRHPDGPVATERFCTLFLAAIADSAKNEPLLHYGAEGLLAYIDKLVASLDGESLARHNAALGRCFDAIGALGDDLLLHIAQSHHPIRKIAGQLLAKAEAMPELDLAAPTLLLHRVLLLNYTYWLAEEDPLPWFTAECGGLCEGWRAGKLFAAISHQQIREHYETVAAIAPDGGTEPLRRLLDLPSHMEIVRLYKEIPEQLRDREAEAAGADRFAENRKLLFLFRIMDTRGLALIHEETLREINRSLVHLIRQQTFEEIERFLLTTLGLLKANVRKYPHTSLQCIQVIGSEVFQRGNSRLVETFLWETVRFGFQYANFTGVNEEWQPIANPAHLANIRAWLSLVQQEPKWCSTLFSALIINLKLSGTCVKDTDLFQRDVSELLNHPIEPIYNLAKQFAKLMPVFFNEIGAEGLLRDVSTELDEIHKRKDRLIHFLRKQSHVESSNLIVAFIEAIFLFWLKGDKAVLASYVPEEVLRQVAASGPYTDSLRTLAGRVWQLGHIRSVTDLLAWDDHRRKTFLASQGDLPEGERRRFDLLVEMYKLCHQKYNLGTEELRHQLTQAIEAGFPEMEQLLADLEICDTFECLQAILDQLERLKGVILSEERFAAKESIYHKRHIAVDIPSVYGRYQERKFDALSLTFRLENLANTYLERLPATVNLTIVTKATFIHIIKCLRLYLRALAIDGIASRKLQTYMSLLMNSIGIKRFSYTQFLDIFRGLSEGVKDIIYTYYTNIHQNNLSIIIPQIGSQNLLPK